MLPITTLRLIKNLSCNLLGGQQNFQRREEFPKKKEGSNIKGGGGGGSVSLGLVKVTHNQDIWDIT